MRQGLYGDNLMIALLAQLFRRDVTVIDEASVRTFLAIGGERPFDESLDGNSLWIGHVGDNSGGSAEMDHYFGILRAGAAAGEPLVPARVDAPKCSSRGTSHETRLRQDKACGGIGKRRLVRNMGFWHRSLPTRR